MRQPRSPRGGGSPQADALEEVAPEPASADVVVTAGPPDSSTPIQTPPLAAALQPELGEQHFTIRYGDIGYSYDSIIGPYLRGAKSIVIEDPYIRLQHQIQNFVRFCETILKTGTIKKIQLVTGYDDKPSSRISPRNSTS